MSAHSDLVMPLFQILPLFHQKQKQHKDYSGNALRKIVKFYIVPLSRSTLSIRALHYFTNMVVHQESSSKPSRFRFRKVFTMTVLLSSCCFLKCRKRESTVKFFVKREWLRKKVFNYRKESTARLIDITGIVKPLGNSKWCIIIHLLNDEAALVVGWMVLTTYL